MSELLISFFVVLLVPNLGIASQKADVIMAVQTIVDAFNKGDSQAFLAACAEETSIVDEIPPHEWHGAGGCAKWMTDYGVFVEKHQVAKAVTTLSRPRRIQIDADTAYVVVPAKCDYKQEGKPVHENVIVTLSLRKTASKWQLTGWTWSRL
jgi:ketosteroid isomerase-like protein